MYSTEHQFVILLNASRSNKTEKVFLFCAANLKLIYFLYMLGEFSVSEVGQQTTKCYCYTLLFCVKEMSPLFSKYHTEFQQLCIPHVNTAFCKECEKRAPHTLLNFSLKHLFWIKLFLILQQIYVDWKSVLSVFETISLLFRLFYHAFWK